MSFCMSVIVQRSSRRVKHFLQIAPSANSEAGSFDGPAPFGRGADGHNRESCAAPDPPVIPRHDRQQCRARNDEQAEDESMMTDGVYAMTQWQSR
jgi:hypothetical protein